MGNVKRSAFEYVIVVVVVAVSLTMGASLYAGRSRVEKSNRLINEVAMLRSALLQYKIVKHHNAENLKQLTTDVYMMDGKSHPFLQRLPTNGEGKAVDPFGNVYAYDAKSGWISSTTPGCERW